MGKLTGEQAEIVSRPILKYPIEINREILEVHEKISRSREAPNDLCKFRTYQKRGAFDDTKTQHIVCEDCFAKIEQDDRLDIKGYMKSGSSESLSSLSMIELFAKR